jgi:fumarylacetoacetate (FAA) hydrolase
MVYQAIPIGSEHEEYNMKLATLKSKESLDGELIVVNRAGTHAVPASQVAPSLREALENWKKYEPKLKALSEQVNAGKVSGMFELNIKDLHSPMPRSFQWVDGSAFLHHVKLVRMARNAELPETLYTVPLMYQGGSDAFLAPTEDIPQIDFTHGTDFEGEICVVTDFVPMGITPEDALKKILVVMLVNDVSLRGLIPEELAQGFGFLQSKPSSAFSPFAVTPDELGEAWKEGRVHLPLLVEYNDAFYGKANGKDMHFHFGQLIAHAARTRDLSAGTIVGSGTVSNEDQSVGSSCLVEKRMIEKLQEGVMKTPFMKVGDTVKIEMRDNTGLNIFGTIYQKVSKRSI